MRMWMVDPKMMCMKHLLGEHVEMHMFLGSMKRGISMQGYCDNNLMEPLALKHRHDELVAEMLRRGYRHKSPMSKADEAEGLVKIPRRLHGVIIDQLAAAAELFDRCEICSVLRDEGGHP